MQQYDPLLRTLLVIGSAIFLFSCASVRLDNVDFGWPVESALTVGSDNGVNDGRYAVSFNVAPIALAEFDDSTALKGTSLRLLRSIEGYYFVTGARFRHVYVFAPGPNELTLNSGINIFPETDQRQLANPALNQRGEYIELIDGKLKLRLDADGIIEEPESEGDGQ